MRIRDVLEFRLSVDESLRTTESLCIQVEL